MKMFSCIVAILAAAALASHAHAAHDKYSSMQLQEVIDAAMMMVPQEDVKSLVETKNYGTAEYVNTCTPADGKWPWPSVDEATGLWKRVVETGELKVAAVQWSNFEVADYKTNPESPTGFWPEYLQKVVDQINNYYGDKLPKKIQVKRTYFETSALVTDEVMRGENVDVSEPFYYINGFNGNKPRIEVMDFSCVSLGSRGYFFTKKGSGITTLDDLVAQISAADDSQVSARSVGFIGKGNYDSNSAVLPASTAPQYLTNHTEMEQAVNNDPPGLVAGYLSEGFPPNMRDNFEVFPTGFMSPRVFLFRKEMPAEQESNDNNEGPLIAGLCALSLTVLVLGVVLSLFIYRERRGNPFFQPLLDPNSV